MGKRKKSSRGPQGPKKKTPLPQNFQCLFCNHETSVTVKLDRKVGVGSLACKVCGQNYQTSINFLSEGVDVYSDWIDACDAVAGGNAANERPAESGYRGTMGAPRNRDRSSQSPLPDDEDTYGADDFVVDDEGDMAEGAYRAGAKDDDDDE